MSLRGPGFIVQRIDLHRRWDDVALDGFALLELVVVFGAGVHAALTMLGGLRKQARRIVTAKDLRRWFKEALDEGIDPL